MTSERMMTGGGGRIAKLDKRKSKTKYKTQLSWKTTVGTTKPWGTPQIIDTHAFLPFPVLSNQVTKQSKSGKQTL